MKKIIRLLILLMVLSPLCVKAALANYKIEDSESETGYLKYDHAIQTVKEIMKSYYIKGRNIQYNFAKTEYPIGAPEEATSQDILYSVCAAYTFSVHREAFGVSYKNFPVYNNYIYEDAYNYYKSTNEKDGKYLIYYQHTADYGEHTTKCKGSGENNKVKYLYNDNTPNDSSGDLQTLMDQLQPGDLVVYTGHALIVYDVVKDENGNVIDVLILNSEQKPFIKTRIDGTSRLSYNLFANKRINLELDIPENDHNTNIKNEIKSMLSNNEEGTMQFLWLSEMTDSFISKGHLTCLKHECAVIRPFYSSENDDAVFNYVVDAEQYKKSKLRTQYPGLSIEKTVDKYDNNSVYVGDELTYTIKVKNTSNNLYAKSFSIKELLELDMVEYIEDVEYPEGVEGGELFQDENGHTGVYFETSNLGSGDTKIFSYTVRVKNNLDNINQEINSKGKFYATENEEIFISTGTVKNKIIPKVTDKTTKYNECYNQYKENNSGLGLIDDIYGCVYGKNLDFNLEDFRFDDFLTRNSLTDTADNPKNKSTINVKDAQNNVFYKMVLNDYIGGLFYSTSTNTNNSEYHNKYFLPRFNSRYKNENVLYSDLNRARTIYSEHFKDGDVLIYNHNLSNISGVDKTNESGIYAYIYINGSFIGVNGNVENNDKRDVFDYTYYAEEFARSASAKTCYEEYGIGEKLDDNKYVVDSVADQLICNYKTYLWAGYGTNTVNNLTNPETLYNFLNYQTLFDKDDYVILRPELLIQEIAQIKVTAPQKTIYIQNYEELDLTGGTIDIINNDGTTAETIELSNDKVEVENFDKSTVGNQTIKVSYEGYEDEFNVEVVSKQSTKISMEKLPDKKIYVQKSEQLDLTGGVIKVTYNDNTTSTISLDNENVTVSGFDNTTLGTNTLTVTYLDHTTKFDVEVISKQVTSIAIKSLPFKVDYVQNSEELDLTGGVIEVTYNDNTNDEISLNNENVKVSGFNNTTLGQKNITVTYQGYTTTFNVEIISKQVTSIAIKTAPLKTDYIQNYEELDLDGGVIEVTYNDNTISTISLTNDDIIVSGFNNSKLGTNTVTVIYQEKTATFNVEIISKQITKITIKTKPTQTTYIQNSEQLDLTGGVIKVTYNDKTTDEVSLDNENVKVSGFNNTEIGENTLTVTYQGYTTTFNVEIISKQVTSIAIKTAPLKTDYIQNYEELDLDGGVIEVTYNDNTTSIISLDNCDLTVSGFDNTEIGKNTLTVTYQGKTTTFDVNIVSKQSTKIDIQTLPIKILYIQNSEQLDLTGGELKVTYNDKTTSTVSLDNENVIVSGFNNTEIGTNTINVIYQGHTTTFDVEIISKQATKISIKTSPLKTDYIQNYEELDLDGGVIEVTYNDNTTSTISLDNENVNVNGFDNTKLGKNTLTVTYQGETTTFDVNIVSKQITKISIKTKPTQTTYIQNSEQLDLTGGVIKVTYNDKTTDDISLTNENVIVSGFNNTEIGTNTLTVTYQEKTTTFDVEIISKQVTKIKLLTLPLKVDYVQNSEQLDLTGGVIEVTYNDKTTSTIGLNNENVKVSGFDNTTLGQKIITVTYQGHEATFNVEITIKQATKIAIKTLPIKKIYVQNSEQLELTGGVVEVTYNDNTTSTISLNNENVKVSGFDNSKLGTNTITVEYQEKTTTFDVEIISKQATKIGIKTLPIKKIYVQNSEQLDLTGGVVEITYNDNTTSTISLDNENVIVSGFDNTKIGKNTLTATYQGSAATFNVEIISKKTTSIEIKTVPLKINYVQNSEQLDLTGGELKVKYNDNTTSTISLNNENVIVSGFDNTKIGKNTITVTYQGYTTTFDVEIISKQVTIIAMNTLLFKTNYVQNSEQLDLTGGAIKVTYNDKTTDEISLNNENVKISGFDNTKTGKNTITVTYQGKTTTFDVEIISKQATKITIKIKPTQTTYIQNSEQLDLTGGAIKVTYNDNTTDEVSLTNENVTVSGFDNTKIGKNTLTVTYLKHTTTFDVEIISKEITKIEIKTLPVKTDYIQNSEKLDLTGGVIKATYNDKTTSTISLTNENVTVTGFNNTEIGKNTLTVTYQGKTTTFDVEIISKQIVKIEMSKLPTKIKYINSSEALDLTGGLLNVIYSDGTTFEMSLTNPDVKISGFDNLKSGKNSITVSYFGSSTTFDIEIDSGDLIENPKTGISGYGILLIMFIILGGIYIMIRKKSNFLKHS